MSSSAPDNAPPPDDGAPQDRGTPRAAPPGQSPFWRRHVQLFAIGGVIVLAGLTALLIPGNGGGFVTGVQSLAPGGQAASAGASGHTGSQGAAAGTGHGAAARRPPATTASSRSGAAKTPEQLVADMRLPRKLAAALRKWDAGSGGAALAQVSGQLDSASQAAGLKLYPPMRQACVNLGSAVRAARSAPPIPDAAMQRAYARALGSVVLAGSACRAAITTHAYGDEDIQTQVNPQRLHRAEADLAAGAKQLYQATVRIQVATRR